MSRTKPVNVFMRPSAPPMAALAALAIMGFARLRAAGFESAGQADAAFRAAGDEAGKAEAYCWMTTASRLLGLPPKSPRRPSWPAGRPTCSLCISMEHVH